MGFPPRYKCGPIDLYGTQAFFLKSLLPFLIRFDVFSFDVLPQFLKLGVSAWQLGHSTLRFSFVSSYDHSQCDVVERVGLEPTHVRL